jgi:hypothetical protein
MVETGTDVVSLQQHLKEVLEGSAFKGSHRSGQFLKYIVEQAIAGHFESLKERVIGVELFGRSPSYDTGDDAIVRVTASDVRRRLLQHYGKYGTNSQFRIRLPLGTYVPEFSREPHNSVVDAHEAEPLSEVTVVSPEPVPVVAPPPPATPPIIGHTAVPWLAIAMVITVLNLLTGIAMLWNHSSRKAEALSVLPWSTFFISPRATQIITSDPNIAEIQAFTGDQISVSDYANHNYLPNPKALTPAAERFCRSILRGDKSAALDVPIAVNIAELAQTSSKKISVRTARSIQISDIKNDDNFVFLGSPRSNPWSGLFAPLLDFRFVFDKKLGSEIIQNDHPRQHELPYYVPTAPGWATGQSFAIIAFVQNPDQNGHVLLLAGANGEGTEAAGKLATDLTRLSLALRNCGIPSPGPTQHFEMLLQLNTMAGSPNNVDVVACHILPGIPVH